MKVLVVFGTRPEAIKMLPVVTALQRDASFDTRVCVTAQHREMLDQVLRLFDVVPHHDLAIMRHAQGLTHITTAILEKMGPVIEAEKPDYMLVHGDTTTTMAASLSAFYHKCPVGHVEAGLRSHNMAQPWPEEMNRRVTDVITEMYFAPTRSSRDNLVREAVPAEKIHVTGNTVIDALHQTVARLEARQDLNSEIDAIFSFLDPDLPVLLVTGHRRENFGAPFLSLCEAIKELAQRYPIQVVYPVHLNPNVQAAVRAMLAGQERVHLIAPLDYLPFVALMKRSYVILTDSGGIQEEGPSLGKPVFVMRNVTERPEAVEAGTVRLVGTDKERILAEVGRVLTDRAAYAAMGEAHNPYGDGRASSRITAALLGRSYEPFTA
jgi:UDP-N-acetylglucosamine 2-epimerase